jgi:LmbE family N-acetylglucosaminyl deacetylase
MTAVVVAPHMDDEVLGCGGLIQRLDDVVVVFVTEREVDVRHAAEGPVVYRGEDRVVEMEAIAAALGYRWKRMGFPVHELDRYTVAEMLEHFDAAISRLEVDLILAPAESHDEDHEQVRRMVRAHMRPHKYAGTVLEYLTWGGVTPYGPAVIVELSETEVALKAKAMEMYATQTAPGGSLPDELYAYGGESVRAYARAAGRLIHAEYAECFVPRRLVGWPIR